MKTLSHRIIASTLGCLAAALLIVPTAALAAQNIFVDISGIKGDSTDKHHRGEIEALSFVWGVAGNPIDPTGEKHVGPITIVKQFDRSSVDLALAALTGKTIPKVAITVASGKRDQARILLTGVVVSGVRTTAESGDIAMEEVDFTFSRIEMEHNVYDGRGNLTDTIVGDWTRPTK